MWYLLILLFLGAMVLMCTNNMKWMLWGLAIFFAVKILAGAPPVETNLYLQHQHHYGVSN